LGGVQISTNGGNIVLEAQGGSVNTMSILNSVTGDAQNAGDITVTANGSLSLTNTVTAAGAVGSGNVALTSNTGAIVDAGRTISGNNLTLQAATGIGVGGNFIDTFVQSVTATNGTTGELFVSNTGTFRILGCTNGSPNDSLVNGSAAINVNGVVNTGSRLTISAVDSLTVNANITAGSVLLLQTSDSGGMADDLTIESGAMVQTLSSDVQLNVDDNLVVRGSVNAARNLSVTVTNESLDMSEGGQLGAGGVATILANNRNQLGAVSADGTGASSISTGELASSGIFNANGSATKFPAPGRSLFHPTLSAPSPTLFLCKPGPASIYRAWAPPLLVGLELCMSVISRSTDSISLRQLADFSTFKACSRSTLAGRLSSVVLTPSKGRTLSSMVLLVSERWGLKRRIA
jgi:hypothetical protein